jgi:uncharacterized membrane protein YgdD (TMEM256/DUF423 family)
MAGMWFIIAALSGLWCVGAGAYGEHQSLSDELREKFRIGVAYQFYHTLALFMVAWLGTRVRSPLIHIAGCIFVIGMVLFSGSLYFMATQGNRSASIVTPYGGMSYMAGWLFLAFLGALWHKRLRPAAPAAIVKD